MDDIKIILYILAAVAYFLFTQWRKAFKTPDEREEEVPRQQPKRAQPQQPPRPVTSFEDILRELQPKVEKGKAAMETVPERQVIAKSPSEASLESQSKYKSYEQATPKALSWEKRAEAIEAQKRSLEKRQPVFKAYAQETVVPTSRYAKMLRNPATVRDAVILSEIFKRKY